MLNIAKSCIRVVQVWCKFCTFAPPKGKRYDKVTWFIKKDIPVMATVTAFVRTASTKSDKNVHLRFRLRDGRNIQLSYTSEIMLNADWWDSKKEKVKSKVTCPKAERTQIDSGVLIFKKLLLKVYDSIDDKSSIDSKGFALLVDKELHPGKHRPAEKTLFDAFDDYMSEVQPTESYCKSVRLVKSCLQRFELFLAIETGRQYKVTFDTFTDENISEFEDFLQDEYTLFDEKGKPLPEYAPIYAAVFEETKMRKPGKRGKNSICKMLKVFRTVWNWALKHQRTTNNPFALFDMPSQTYGTPYYITLAERNKIADYDLSDNPRLAVQRDIFVFQCLVGCRVSDLYNFTPANVINGTIQYIAQKTAREKPRTVIVPLNSRAKEILMRYYDGVRTDGKLLPFIKEQKYNVRIKQIFKQCGITRNVTIYNSTTGKEEIKPICDIASSHLARRTFVGNLYKKVGNVDLVASLSGHTANSAAFFRYRDIDLETKQDLVDKID